MANVGAIVLLILATSSIAFPQRVCPNLQIEMPTRVLQVETEETFRIRVSDGDAKLRYTWGSSLGNIINLNSGPEMKLVVPRKYNAYNATIFVRVDGLMDGCPDTTSEIIGVAALPIGEPVDTFGDLKKYDVYARLDNYMIALDNGDSTVKGLIDVVFGPDETRSKRIVRLRNIIGAFRSRKYDVRKIEFAFSETESGNGSTKLWIVPHGASRRWIEEDRPGAVFVDGPTVMRSPQSALPKRTCDCKW